uniref:PRA1 family protein n=1 Tax=Neolamprologus brichardi TaxID=32507 RepID=A0A3Q4I3N0_NEOBR
MPVIQQSLTKLLSRPLATFTEVMDLAWWHHCRRAKAGSITKQICLHRHKRYLDVLMEMRIEGFNLLIYLNLRQPIVVVSVVFVVSVWVGENGAAINNFKKQKPSAFIILIMVASCILISMLGSIVVFMWAITLPLILIFAHASCRKRNMQNKLENKMDGSGLKKTFMGILLDSLGQQEETIQKIHNFLN